MGLNIVVCVKNVPSTLTIDIDSEGRPKTAGIVCAMNAFDEYAVEEAVRIKERVPGTTVTALTLGPESDQPVLRDAISRGCDTAIHICGPEFEGSDVFATSRALASAICKLSQEKPIHLALFGKNSNDGNSGAVGGMVASWLDWPSVLSVKKVESIDEKSATVWRMMEDGIDVVQVGLPAAIGTVKEINEPRIPSLKGKMAAKKAVIAKWTAADIGLKPEDVGAVGSKTWLARCSQPPARGAGVRVEGTSPAEQAAKLVDLLIERKLI
jgi:electron transfer flavoprotein beta subunit